MPVQSQHRVGLRLAACQQKKLAITGDELLALLAEPDAAFVLTAALVAFAAEAPVITVSFCAKLFHLPVFRWWPVAQQSRHRYCSPDWLHQLQSPSVAANFAFSTNGLSKYALPASNSR